MKKIKTMVEQETHYLDSLEKLAIIKRICEDRSLEAYGKTNHSKAFAFEMISYLSTHSIGEFYEKYHALNNI